jgi:hypothetical protein
MAGWRNCFRTPRQFETSDESKAYGNRAFAVPIWIVKESKWGESVFDIH